MTLGLEALAEHAIESGSWSNPGLAPSIFELSGIYQRLVASGPRPPSPRFTVVVELDPATDPTLVNVCRQRGFLARLIETIANSSPAVIVIDKYFGDKSCEPTDPGTVGLRAAVAHVSRSVPIVVGRRIDQPHSSPYGRKSTTASPLVPALEFGQGPAVREGIINVDRDTRRLPLGWTVLSGANRAERRATLALAAAQAYDPKLLIKYPLLDAIFQRREHPYISFIDRENLRRYATYSTTELMCGSREPTPTSCSRADLDYLRGRIVIIGEINRDMDSHFSVVGEVPGFVLHANYIEALLDGRFFRPVSGWVNYAAGFVIYLAVHWILLTHHHAVQVARGWRALLVLLKALGWVCVVIVGVLAALYFVVMHVGWYVNPATMGLVILVIKLSELVFAKVPYEPGGQNE